MPLYQLVPTTTGMFALWHIQENEAALMALAPAERVPTVITHPQKRVEYLAARILTGRLMQQLGQPYLGLTKNEFGKPFLVASSWHISQSHSYPYVAVIVSQNPAGVDIEQPKPTLLRVAPRVFSEPELQNANNNLHHLCVLWCAKETLIKLYGKKDLTLKQELSIEPFVFANRGILRGCIRRNTSETFYTLEYRVEENFILVITP
jgi:4'-phosphopantetheinyl transferase